MFDDQNCRASRQEAYIYCPHESLEPDHNSCASRLRHRLRLSSTCIKEAIAERYFSQEYLFPDPMTDKFYRWLLYGNAFDDIFTLQGHLEQYVAQGHSTVREELCHIGDRFREWQSRIDQNRAIGKAIERNVRKKGKKIV
jgi:hypothetical protein